jgi:hypothetical protein
MTSPKDLRDSSNPEKGPTGLPQEEEAAEAKQEKGDDHEDEGGGEEEASKRGHPSNKGRRSRARAARASSPKARFSMRRTSRGNSRSGVSSEYQASYTNCAPTSIAEW